MNLSVRIDDAGLNSLDRVNLLLSHTPEGIRNATLRALERAGNQGRTKGGQFAAAEYTISKGTFMSHTKNQYHIQYNGGTLAGGVASVSISYAGAVIPLLEFKTGYSRKGGMQTQVKRSGGAAALQHVFAATVFGRFAAYERLGPSRFPVEGKYGPSTAHMMQNEEIVEQMDETIREAFDNRIDHEIMRILNGW